MKLIKFIFLIIFSPLFCLSQNWKNVGNGVTGISSSTKILFFCNDTASNLLYLGGRFNNASGVSVSNIATWDGINYQSLGNFPVSVAGSIAVDSNIVYCASGTTVYKFNGSVWNALPAFNDGIRTLAIVNGELYAGGEFLIQGTQFNGDYLRGIAKWNGTAWDSLGYGVGDFILGWDGTVNAIVEYQNKLVAAGMFRRAGSDTVYNIAMWDGTSWSSLGSGMYDSNIGGSYNEDVYDLYADGNDLYAAGRFKKAGGIIANGIAKWDGTNWDSLGGGGIRTW